ncbi:PH domain-containing protein [Candidatus Saccharibacteria bacterium]|nr:PH domain-containing protein [Candidatus Saccharibacteria bacterium]
MKQDLVKVHHARSKKDFPELKLKDDEYVALAVYRSKLGLTFIWGAAALAIIIITLTMVLVTVSVNGQSTGLINNNSLPYLYLVIVILFAAIILMASVSTTVYKGNRLYVTNKRLIHYEQTSLTAKSVNTIDLVSVEDVSFKQKGIVDQFFQIGSLRMSTVGDETTYTFKYAAKPTDELETISYLIHVAKTRRKIKSQDDN